MSSAEFTRWKKYADREYFGYPWELWKHGEMVAHIVNAVRSTIPMPKGARRPPLAKASDYHPATKPGMPPLTKSQQEGIRRKNARKRK